MPSTLTVSDPRDVEPAEEESLRAALELGLDVVAGVGDQIRKERVIDLRIREGRVLERVPAEVVEAEEPAEPRSAARIRGRRIEGVEVREEHDAGLGIDELVVDAPVRLEIVRALGALVESQDLDEGHLLGPIVDVIRVVRRAVLDPFHLETQGLERDVTALEVVEVSQLVRENLEPGVRCVEQPRVGIDVESVRLDGDNLEQKRIRGLLEQGSSIAKSLGSEPTSSPVRSST
jgi:hypothetical protein